MMSLCKKSIPVFVVLLALLLGGGSLVVDTADARSRGGGKSFRSAPKTTTTQSTAPAQPRKSGGFGSGLAGGLLGGAMGAMLFGSLFGGGGEGMGILPILLVAGLGFFLFRKFAKSRQTAAHAHGQAGGFGGGGGFGQAMNGAGDTHIPPPPVFNSPQTVDEGLNEIRQTDRNFDTSEFLEIASEVFFKVQAGWMRRDLSSHGNLLGAQLASEYELEFAQMRKKGIVNKLESIAVRQVDIVAAGNDGKEDFVTVLFKANLLDYTVDETTGDLVAGSMTQPVRFEEEWTWSRPMGTHSWKLEGIKVVDQ